MITLLIILSQLWIQAVSHGIRSRRCDWVWHFSEYLHLAFWISLVMLIFKGVIVSPPYPIALFALYVAVRFSTFQHFYNIAADKPFGYLGDNSKYDEGIQGILTKYKVHPALFLWLQFIILLGAAITLIYWYR